METILIVDDEPDLRFILRQVLENDGFECLEARDGEHALEVLANHPNIALVLTDFQMPRMNGLQLLADLTAHPVLRGIPTIMVTSDYSPALFNQASLTGVKQVLYKPYVFSEINCAIHTLLNSRQVI